MPKIRILTESELRTIVPLDMDAVTCVENAFRALAVENAVQMPPILRLDVPDSRGEVDVKTAYIHGLSSFAIKVSPGFFDNPKDRTSEHQRSDGLAVEQNGLGAGALAGQWLPHRRSHSGRWRCRGKPSGTEGRVDCNGLRGGRSGQAATRGPHAGETYSRDPRLGA